MPWPAALRVALSLPFPRPAAGALLAVAFLGATAGGVMTLLRPGDALAAACLVAALACLVPSRRAATGLACLAGVAAAAAHGAAARDRALHPSLLTWFDAQAGDADRLPALVTLDAVLVADAVPVEDGVRLVLDVEHVRAGPGASSSPDRAWMPLSGRVQLHVAGAEGAGHLRAWTAGRRIRAPAVLRRPQMLLNFGGPSPFWQRLRRPFVLAGSIKSAALVDVERGAWWEELAARARWRVRDVVTRFIAPHDALAAGVTTAILIGDRAGLDDDVVRTLQEAGTYHVIAISGGNIALLTGLCFVVFRTIVRSPRLVSALTLLVTLIYGAVVGGDPSVARAVTAAAIYLGIGLLGLAPSPMATLRAAACALAVADPLVVSDVGAWLSFGATAGILLFASRIANAVPWHGRAGLARGRLTPGVLIRPVVVLVAATISAELVLLPIAAAVFGRVTFAGVILNLAAIPAMAFVEIGGLVTVLAGSIWPAIGWISAAVVSRAAHVLVSSSALADAWPWLWWRVPAAPWFWMAAYYAAVITIWRAPASRYGRRIARAAMVMTLGIVALAPALERTRPVEGRLRVSLLDVGQGDAILVQLPAGQSLLVDTGGSPGTFDIGSRVVTPAAWSLGVRTLTWLALTHGDRDHAGGAYGVTEDLQPREIWEGVPVPRHPVLTALRDLAAGRGIVWRTVLAGTHVTIGSVEIDALHPAAPDWERQKVRNDDSIVLRIRYGGVEILLTGDAGPEFESHVPLDLSEAPIRILKAGHHGSRTSTSDRLVEAMRPQVALISVGRGNLFGHPSAEVIDRLRGAGAQIFRTDRDGAISVETDGVTARILTALGRSWTIASHGPS